MEAFKKKERETKQRVEQTHERKNRDFGE